VTTAAPTGDSLDMVSEQLAPVRLELLDIASTRAGGIVDSARAEADAIVAEAEASAADAVRRAEAHARATAGARSEQRLERDRADAHGLVLRTRSTIAGRLVDATHRTVLNLRDDPRYPALLDQLEDLAHRQLGPNAAIERAPEQRGGIVARHEGRRVDYTLAALADRALAQLGDDIEGLWT